MKKIISIILTAVILVSALPITCIGVVNTVFYVGDDITVTLDVSSATLTFSGTGDIPDYSSSSRPAWYQYESSFSKIVIEKGITSIGSYSFANCPGIKSIDIPDTVTRIGDHAFYYCVNLGEISLPDSVTELGNYAMANCRGAVKIVFPKHLKKIDFYTAAGCSALKTVILPEDCEDIGNSSFSQCSKLTFPALPASLKRIGMYAFSDCLLFTSVKFPEGLEIIGERAFANITKLTSVSLPESLKSFDGTAFLGTGWYNKLPSGINTVNGYTLALKGTPSGKKLEIPEDAKVISSNTLSDLNYVTEVVIPNGVERIQSYAIYNLSSLYTLTVPDSVKDISKYAFGYVKSANLNPSVVYPFTVYGHAGSESERYADSMRFDFICMCEEGPYISCPNCKDGGIAVIGCKYCGKELRKVEMKPQNHSFTEKIVDATCTENGYTLKKCEKCGYEEYQNTVTASGHIPEESYKLEKKATCAETGLLTLRCRICSEIYDSIVIAKTEHVFSEESYETVPPSCTEDGMKHYLCAVCGEIIKESIIPAEGHKTESSWKVLIPSVPVEEKPGFRVKQCEKCRTAIEYEYFILGDINGDFLISPSDSRMMRLLLSSTSYEMGIYDNADIDGDGDVTAKDARALKKIIGT